MGRDRKVAERKDKRLKFELISPKRNEVKKYMGVYKREDNLYIDFRIKKKGAHDKTCNPVKSLVGHPGIEPGTY